MDSLLANYASSDEENEESEQRQQPASKFSGNFSSTPKTSSSLVSSLPPPKSSSSSSLFLSLPPPKSLIPNPPPTLTKPSSSNPGNQSQEGEQQQRQLDDSRLPSKFLEQSSSVTKLTGHAKPSSLFSSLPQPIASSLFPSLPQPKTQNPNPQILSNPSSSSDRNPKRIVQFRPPINPSLIKSDDDDFEEDDNDDEEKQRKKPIEFESMSQTSSVKSFLSSIPAPKNSMALGVLPSSSGTGRRSILEADVPTSSLKNANTVSEATANSNVENYDGELVDGSSLPSLGAFGRSSDYTVGGAADPSNWGSESERYANYDSYGGYGNSGGDPSNLVSGNGDYANYDSYGSYGNHGHYESNWVDGSTATVAPDTSIAAVASVARLPGKRGRNDIPQEIIEVKQDELIKNRPREDQVKLTGIAFGPSYQPASTKGKPSKLHKRKHQIGSLYFDMRQKEMELAERRSKGFLTKAETQAKYGW